MPSRRRARQRPARITRGNLLVCLPVLLLEGLAAVCVVFYTNRDIPWFGLAALALHLSAAAFFLIQWRHGRSAGRARLSRYYLLLCSLLTLFLPVVGILGMFLGLVAAKFFMKPLGLARDFEQQRLLLDETFTLHSTDELSVFLREELNIEPLLDIINSGDSELKRGAIKLLLNTGTPEAVRLLKQCLSDTESEIRFIAHTALSRLEENFTRAMVEAKEEAAGNNIEGMIGLAKVYTNYAGSGLPEHSFRMHYYRQARDLYRNVLELEPGRARIALALGDICHLMGEHVPARYYYAGAAVDEDTAIEAFLGLIRMKYDTKQMDQIQEQINIMADVIPKKTDDPFINMLYSFWTNPGEDGRG